MNRILTCMLTAVMVAGWSALAVTASAQDDFKVIAHPGTGVASLTRDEVSRLFMKKTKKWPNGQAVQPVDLDSDSATRASFTTAVHRRSVSAIEAYWQKQIFSGRSLPPVVHKTDADVIAFVKSTPGAIGYVSASAATGGVSVVSIK